MDDTFRREALARIEEIEQEAGQIATALETLARSVNSLRLDIAHEAGGREEDAAAIQERSLTGKRPRY